MQFSARKQNICEWNFGKPSPSLLIPFLAANEFFLKRPTCTILRMAKANENSLLENAVSVLGLMVARAQGKFIRLG
jgi:hypothetical protein